MKKLAVLFCLIGIVSCSSTQRITQIEYDKNRQLYTGYVEGNSGKVYLRDDQYYLIRSEADKDRFIKNYNAYWALDQKYRTNDFYNHYYQKTSDQEYQKSQNLIKNHDYSSLYYSGVKNMKLSNYTGALKNFDSLIDLYPEIQYYSDVLFLKAYCYEQLNDNSQSLSNYNQFINLSVQKYSALFYEDETINTDIYLQELKYSYNTLNNTNDSLPEEILESDTAKYYNHSFSPGFNFYLPGNRRISTAWGLGASDDYGLMVGSSFLISLNQFIDIYPSVFLSGSAVGAALNAPIQVFRSKDRRFGFEITPIVNYSYYYRARLSVDDDTTYDIRHTVLNFGVESSIGFYILPSLHAGFSYKYMYYNQNNPYLIKDRINGTNYLFSYKGDSYYYLDLRYYFVKEAGIEAALKNNDFLVGMVFMNSFYIGYNISQKRFIANYSFF